MLQLLISLIYVPGCIFILRILLLVNPSTIMFSHVGSYHWPRRKPCILSPWCTSQGLRGPQPANPCREPPGWTTCSSFRTTGCPGPACPCLPLLRRSTSPWSPSYFKKKIIIITWTILTNDARDATHRVINSEPINSSSLPIYFLFLVFIRLLKEWLITHVQGHENRVINSIHRCCLLLVPCLKHSPNERRNTSSGGPICRLLTSSFVG